MNMNATKKKFDELLSSISKDDKYEIEAKILMAQYVNAILDVMDSTDVSRKRLASKIGTSASYITQVFNGKKTINFLTLAKIQDALKIKFSVGIKKREKQVKYNHALITEMSKSFKETNSWAYQIKHDYEISDFSPVPDVVEKEIPY